MQWKWCLELPEFISLFKRRQIAKKISVWNTCCMKPYIIMGITLQRIYIWLSIVLPACSCVLVCVCVFSSSSLLSDFPLFRSWFGIAHYWMQGKQEAKGVKYDGRCVHIFKTDSRLPDFFFFSVALCCSVLSPPPQFYYTSHFYASDCRLSAQRAKSPVLVRQTEWIILFSSCWGRKSGWWLTSCRLQPLRQFGYGWGLEGNGVFACTLRIGDNYLPLFLFFIITIFFLKCNCFQVFY